MNKVTSPMTEMGCSWSCGRQRNGQLPGSRASWNQSAERGGEGPARLTLGKSVSWNPAEMGKTLKEIEKNPF